jgi:uncharacterized repeat protein (TIGR01451 family)
MVHKRLLWTILPLLVLLAPIAMHPAAPLVLPGAVYNSVPSGVGHSRFQTTTISIPTYPYADYLTPTYAPTYNMVYDKLNWKAYNNAHPVPSPHDYELLILENDTLVATLLPELGGRLYHMIFKPTGHNELYQNPVIKPTCWGPPEQGWWLAAGGIEWGLPVDEHGYEWGEEWDYQVITSTAGVTVTLRDTITTDRIRAAVTVHVPTDRGYLMITPRIENPTGSNIDYKYWTNAMLAPGAANTVSEGLCFVFNSNDMSVHSTGDDRLPGHGTVPTGPDYRFSWPIYNEIDFSRLDNWRQWLGFFEYPQAAADFAGVYDTIANEGVVRVFPSNVAQGSKGFGFGWSDPTNPRNWTDDGSAYVELHGGVAPTFWDTARIPAGQSLTWTEYWYPVSGIDRLSAATAEAALGVHEEDGHFAIGVHATAPHPAGTSALLVWDRDDCTGLAHWKLPDIDPANPFSTAVATGGRTLAHTSFVYLDGEGQLLAAVNPRDCLPPTSTVAPMPPWTETSSFSVTWTGRDSWAQVAAYDVQAREGYDGVWTDWLTDTSALSGVFTGTHGQTYFFRSRARDVHGNQEPYGDGEWGQAFTTVLVEPAPVLATSHKTAVPRVFAPGQAVSYAIRVDNTGNLTANATLNDRLPPSMRVLTNTLTATIGLTLINPDNVIHWVGTVPPGVAIQVTYTLSPTVTTPLGVLLTNTVEITGSVLGPFTRQAAVVQAHLAWLPLIIQEWKGSSQ